MHQFVKRDQVGGVGGGGGAEGKNGHFPFFF